MSILETLSHGDGVGVSHGDSPARLVLARGAWLHLDAVDDGAHTHAQSAACAVLRHAGEVCLGVEGDGLVAGVIADHVALATVHTHVLVDHRHHLLRVVEAVVCSNSRQRLTDDILEREEERGKLKKKKNK